MNAFKAALTTSRQGGADFRARSLDEAGVTGLMSEEGAAAEVGLSEMPLVLPAVLDLTAAEPLCRALRERVPAGPVLLDGGEVERVSTACLQVLAAGAAAALAAGRGFHVRAPSQVLSEAVADLGLTAMIPMGD